MKITPETEKLLEQLDKKFKNIGQDLDTHLEGLLYGKPITYWDYIQTDALLNLQIQRTNQPDEMVFIMYHQINELLFKMILWEIQQVSHAKELTATFFSERLLRVSRYFDMLTSSFNIMTTGMEIEQYLKFRNTLTPASGFQSAQYRKIEFASTELINLIDARFREKIDRNTPYEHALEHLYWQAAGKNFKTGKKSYLLKAFEEKYKNEFIAFTKEYNTINLYSKFKSLPQEVKENETLLKAMRHYDYTVNVTWVMAHYNTAKKYLNHGKEPEEATGGSDWAKYMHPKYQKRIFFPSVWSEKEIKDWGKNV
ncbi:tryptophan 2,3-dioxygenase [Aureisphaera sp. CAU 1614]|uniref:Tryptophan 2,3-dioxygenase n=1 Tax=Halomarinibacterium sedimenti TaxID=2857106 RepID=A0A9X1FNY1_9FLAO|nr:tryptophan 2,3-dioxygenase family protein [Halomarinibacterium sedimenti]MBW2937122.1 tryptophan 2,3-dioxygenase [Halomarinibacterium sedimenti]HAT63687.1 tryptophan 2,3-dioxygenase [Flavobacteriaceae bacterium]|tara:strand:+ start:20852 stop:21784 length:933 start_codon:yes stop_codon:yes gene_type:complete